MAADLKQQVQLEITHILFIDTVGYSKLTTTEQRQIHESLKGIVQGTECFRRAERTGQLIRIPTGDGMALVFTDSPESPITCALEVCRIARERAELKLRMGIHSGPVTRVNDVNGHANVAGSAINLAERVMSCADAGHILLSRRAADDLEEYERWHPFLHHLGQCESKHGIKLDLVNFYSDEFGNPERPSKFEATGRDGVSRSRRRLAVTALAVLLVGAVLYLIVRSDVSVRPNKGRTESRAEKSVPEKSIAVLPFENLSGNPENEFFTDGVHEDILNALAKVSDLKVISRTSVMQYKSGPQRNLRQIARELGVSYILKGSVQRSGDRVRVSAQLIDARVDTHIWAQPYDRKLTDVFAIQSELAEEIANRLQATLLPAEKAAIEHPPTTDLAAYDLYTRAKRLAETITFDSLGKSNLFTAIKLLEEAVERDPKFVLAYCALARFDDQLYLLGLDRSPDRLARAGHAIATALAVDPDSGAAHLASAYHRYSGFLDYEGARLELAKARASLPNEPWVFELRGFIERRQGQYDESIQSMMQALNLDPRNVFLLQQISTSYDSLRRFPESRAMLQRARKVAPEDNITKVALAMVDLSGNANPKPARDAIEAVVRKDPGAAAEVARMWWFVGLCQRDHDATKRALQVMSPGSCRDQGLAFPNAWCQGVAAQVAGDRAGAETAFLVARGEAEKLVAQQPDYGGAWGVLGVIDAALGRKEEAIRESRRAVELLPIERDSINGELLCEYLAMAYAAVGETQAALDELEKILPLPGQLNYGELSLNPLWDPLRGDPRFARMVAALAPKNDSIDRSR